MSTCSEVIACLLKKPGLEHVQYAVHKSFKVEAESSCT